MSRKSKTPKSIHPDILRIQELESLEYDDELTDTQFEELETLRHIRKEAQVLSIPRPTCCFTENAILLNLFGKKISKV